LQLSSAPCLQLSSAPKPLFSPPRSRKRERGGEKRGLGAEDNCKQGAEDNCKQGAEDNCKQLSYSPQSEAMGRGGRGEGGEGVRPIGKWPIPLLFR
jgi:hypothetical protein